MAVARRILTLGLLVAVVVVGTDLVSAAARTPQRDGDATSSVATAVSYPALGGDYVGVAPTALGLPQLGETGTLGAGQLVSALNSYVSSGSYEAQLSAVDSAATTYLNTRLAETTGDPRRICSTVYRRVHVKHVRLALFRQVRACHTQLTAPQLTGKPAIVLDIDETSLSNLQGLQATGYTEAGLLPAALGDLPAITPTLALYRDAVDHHVAVFFVTGRSPSLQATTASNLTAAGYSSGYAGLEMKPDDDTTEAFKSAARAAIEKMGYDIVANVGDQESDLDGGDADADFKLPDPFYFIADS